VRSCTGPSCGQSWAARLGKGRVRAGVGVGVRVGVRVRVRGQGRDRGRVPAGQCTSGRAIDDDLEG